MEAVITNIVFNVSGIFVLLDTVNYAAYTYRYTFDVDWDVKVVPKVSISFVRRVSLPSSLSQPTAFMKFGLSDDAVTMYVGHHNEGALDVVDLNASVIVGSAKAKAGNTAAWTVAKGSRVCAAGSYIHDIRAFTVTHRSGNTSGAGTLNRFASIAVPEKVAHLQWTSDATFLLLQFQGPSGALQLWMTDVDYSREEVPVLVATMQDADFADADGITIAYYPSPSTTRRRDVIFALVKGSDVVAYRFDNAHEAVDRKTSLSAIKIAEVHDAHDGEAIKWVGFGGRGTVIWTGSECDNRNGVRLWSLQP